ncbi:MAG: cob(I)yrinic acid a,c-diamide adenosyltransferase [Patescibacteria group bacterium]
MKFYTGKGDDGTTMLFGGANRVRKDDARFEALGVLDELNAYLGVCRALCHDDDMEREVFTVQEKIFILQAEVGSANESQVPVIGEEKLKALEASIEKFSVEVGEIRNFIISGSETLSAHFDYARTLARRTERALVAANVGNSASRAYLNRLSSFLFVLARAASKRVGVDESKPSYI